MSQDVANVILPVNIPGYFSYVIPAHLKNDIAVGQRVIVQFGRGQRKYTAIVKEIFFDEEEITATKTVEEILDDEPIVTKEQFDFWEWVQDYYMCRPGEVMNAALPGGFKTTSETRIILSTQQEIDEEALTDNEFLVYEALLSNHVLTIKDIGELSQLKRPHALVRSLLKKGVVFVEEEAKQKYKPRKRKYILFSDQVNSESGMERAFESLSRAPKQLEALMLLIQLNDGQYVMSDLGIDKLKFQHEHDVSAEVVKQLATKGVIEIVEETESRIPAYLGGKNDISHLSNEQLQAIEQIKKSFVAKKPVLLHGVTASGKTEIYVHLIQEALNQGKQILYLLPEIALTTQLVQRLRHYFGEKVCVYHSRYGQNEQVEVWSEIMEDRSDSKGRFQIVMGARSALFLPFRNLGLVIVDEEHDSSFKQQDPAPRYHARDAAVMLAHKWDVPIIMGSATPAIESFHNTESGKYDLVKLTTRYSGISMPDIKIIDIAEAHRKKKMKSHFSETLIQEMSHTLEKGEQIILFQNRRGFAPLMICYTCGHVPQCVNCDVSLTYHKFDNRLKCHYCGFSREVVKVCDSCGSDNVELKGFGTEKIEEELAIYFPEASIGRLDLDTTRKRNAFQQIISDFETGNIQILVGTQMVTKGLDFPGVSLVGILNADSLLNFPDFRAFERSFQLLEQVAGRSGRNDKQGLVMIQSFQPEHVVLKHVVQHDFMKMYEQQILERRKFLYPPFVKMIVISMRHRNPNVLLRGAKRFGEILEGQFGKRVLGPEAPLVPRIRNYYIQRIQLKLEQGVSVVKSKKIIDVLLLEFRTNKENRTIDVQLNVDPY